MCFHKLREVSSKPRRYRRKNKKPPCVPPVRTPRKTWPKIDPAEFLHCLIMSRPDDESRVLGYFEHCPRLTPDAIAAKVGVSIEFVRQVQLRQPRADGRPKARWLADLDEMRSVRRSSR